MVEPIRIAPDEVRNNVKSGTALLVCAYPDEARFKRLQLEDAISLSDFKAKLPTLPKTQEIIFYCA